MSLGPEIIHSLSSDKLDANRKVIFPARFLKCYKGEDDSYENSMT